MITKSRSPGCCPPYPRATRLGLSRRRRMEGASGRFGGNAVRVCGSLFGAGMVLLVRIRNAHMVYSTVEIVRLACCWSLHRGSGCLSGSPAGKRKGRDRPQSRPHLCPAKHGVCEKGFGLDVCSEQTPSPVRTK